MASSHTTTNWLIIFIHVILCLILLTFAQGQTCDPPFVDGPTFTRNGTCVLNCGPQEFYQPRGSIQLDYECIPCNPCCDGCFYGTSQSCLRCQGGYFKKHRRDCFVNGDLQAEGDISCQAFDCVSECAEGYFADRDEWLCKPCYDDSCNRCEHPREDGCRNCSYPLWVEDGICVVNCTKEDYTRDEDQRVCAGKGVDGTRIGIIVGSILAVLLVGALVAFAAFYVYKHRPFSKRKADESTLPTVAQILNDPIKSDISSAGNQSRYGVKNPVFSTTAASSADKPQATKRTTNKVNKNKTPDLTKKPLPPDVKQKKKLPTPPPLKKSPPYGNIGEGNAPGQGEGEPGGKRRGPPPMPMYGNVGQDTTTPMGEQDPSAPMYGNIGQDGDPPQGQTSTIPLYGNQEAEGSQHVQAPMYGNVGEDGGQLQEEYMNTGQKPNPSHLYLSLEKESQDGIRPPR